MAFADGLPGHAIGFDICIGNLAKRADFARSNVQVATSNAQAVATAPLILSLVTADKALTAAHETARSISKGGLYCDMNSVAPETKRAAALVIEAAGGRYADVAVMAPVLPARRSVALLVSGSHAEEACAALASFGFTPRAIAGDVGSASTIKMIRSVMVKGLEALTAECFLAAETAGVTDEVTASLGASWPGTDWAAKADYNLERMLAHGERRAAEMEEVVRMLDTLGTGSLMSRAAAQRQRDIGALHLAAPASLAAKARLILGRGEIAA